MGKALETAWEADREKGRWQACTEEETDPMCKAARELLVTCKEQRRPIRVKACLWKSNLPEQRNSLGSL